MTRRYRAARAILDDLADSPVEVTGLGGPRQFLNVVGPADYIALARDFYLQGDLTVDELEAELDTTLGLTCAP